MAMSRVVIINSQQKLLPSPPVTCGVSAATSAAAVHTHKHTNTNMIEM